MRRRAAFAALALWTLASGCYTLQRINSPLKAYDRSAGYRSSNAPTQGRSRELLVVLTFSGGGTRAAALAFGVLEELRRTRIVAAGERRRLLDEVDMISSVSGGSFTAAYYALEGERAFQEFPKRFLYASVENELIDVLVSAKNFGRLLFTGTTRLELAAEFYDDRLFHGARFRDLAKRPGAPFIVINATDLALGSRFEFTQRQFDFLCSDLSRFKLARAVAASSAFPVAFAPITLKNFAGTCGFTPPDWIGRAMTERVEGTRVFKLAHDLSTYYAPPPDHRPYIHLVDGGIADNLGVRALLTNLDVVAGLDDPTRGLEETTGIREVLVIVVNAAVRPTEPANRFVLFPGLVDVLATVANAPMDNVTADTVELLRSRFRAMEFVRRVAKDCRGEMDPREFPVLWPGRPEAYPRVRVAEVRFEALLSERDREYFNNLPTSFELPPDAVDALRRAASKLLCENPEYRAFREDLDAEGGCEVRRIWR